VLRTLVFREIEVQGEDGAYYLMRILPYRTSENVIDGLVLTFVDVSRIKWLKEGSRRILGALKSSPTCVFGQGGDLRYAWIAGDWLCHRLFGRAPAEVIGATDSELIPGKEGAELEACKRGVLERNLASRERITLELDGLPRAYDLFLEPLRNDAGEPIGIFGVMSLVTEPGAANLEPTPSAPPSS
jgi:two-component system CheB/CheR fusion protein